jgi:RND family efflux transporter MFP subunit
MTKLAIGALAFALACSRAEGGTAPAPSASAAGATPTIEAVKVVSKLLDTTTHLEGELTPYERVDLFARVSGFVSAVPVDRGSHVKKGELLVSITAPELGAQRAEAQAKLQGDKTTLDRLRAASQTPGAVAGNEIDVTQSLVQADQAKVDSFSALERYLVVTAPFDGVVTERNVDPGALVGPSSMKMLHVEQVQRLRLTVAVPESLVGALGHGMTTTFTVRAQPGAQFTSLVQRIAESLDQKTRSMPVELDVDNTDGRLAPGMFADVRWPVKRSAPSLFVPVTAIVQSTEKTFVARVRNGTVDQVPIQRGVVQGDLIEVFGNLSDGDVIAKRGTEELRQGAHVEVKP